MLKILQYKANGPLLYFTFCSSVGLFQDTKSIDCGWQDTEITCGWQDTRDHLATQRCVDYKCSCYKPLWNGGDSFPSTPQSRVVDLNTNWLVLVLTDGVDLMTKHSVKELENTHTELKNLVTAEAQGWGLNQMPLMCHLYQFQRSFHLTRIDWVGVSAIVLGVHLPLRSPSPSMSTDAGNYFWLESLLRWYFLVVWYSSPALHNVICWVMQGREMDW